MRLKFVNFKSIKSLENIGFIVDTFVKPPVSIKITFKQPINIDRIILDAKVKAKISNGFIIFSSIDLKDKEDDFIFHQIARCTNEKACSTHIYEFLKRRIGEDLEEKSEIKTIKSFFSTRSLLHLQEVSAIKITILKTLNSTTPCLKSIKVLGFMTEKIAKNSIDASLPTASNRSDEILSKKKVVDIPNEFIDEITHEMIRNPIRLPSNKVVDKKTLDTFLDEQKKNNECDKDPFTCVPFSRTYKPLIDELLKSKIDKFLFDNQDADLKFKIEPGEEMSIEKKITKKRPCTTSNYCSKIAKLDRTPIAPVSLKCNCCLNFKSEKNDLYELFSCRHVFCRHCIKSMNKVCVVCEKAFENNQIVHLDRKNF